MLNENKPMILNNEDNLLAGIDDPEEQQVIEPRLEIKTMKLTLVKGNILDFISSSPVEATIDIIDLEKNKVISSVKSNSKTGKFLVSLPSGKNYGVSISANGYLFHSENFNVPESKNYVEINSDYTLKKIDAGSKVVLRNIFYDFDKATLRPESVNELDRLAMLLNEAVDIKIQVLSHTDNVGNPDYNQKLSENRAKAVVDYLVKEKMISEERLSYKGLGEANPIADNSTANGRQSNRRTEFEILKN